MELHANCADPLLGDTDRRQVKPYNPSSRDSTQPKAPRAPKYQQRSYSQDNYLSPDYISYGSVGDNSKQGYARRADTLKQIHAQSSADTSGIGDSLQRIHAFSSIDSSGYGDGEPAPATCYTSSPDQPDSSKQQRALATTEYASEYDPSNPDTIMQYNSHAPPAGGYQAQRSHSNGPPQHRPLATANHKPHPAYGNDIRPLQNDMQHPYPNMPRHNPVGDNRFATMNHKQGQPNAGVMMHASANNSRAPPPQIHIRPDSIEMSARERGIKHGVTAGASANAAAAAATAAGGERVYAQDQLNHTGGQYRYNTAPKSQYDSEAQHRGATANRKTDVNTLDRIEHSNGTTVRNDISSAAPVAQPPRDVNKAMASERRMTSHELGMTRDTPQIHRARPPSVESYKYEAAYERPALELPQGLSKSESKLNVGESNGRTLSRTGSSNFLGANMQNATWLRWSQDRRASFKRRLDILERRQVELEENRVSTPVMKARKESVMFTMPGFRDPSATVAEDEADLSAKLARYMPNGASRARGKGAATETNKLSLADWNALVAFWEHGLFVKMRYLGIVLAFISLVLAIVSITNQEWSIYESKLYTHSIIL